MMRCHQHKKTERERTKIRSKWFCRVGRLDRHPSPRLISPRVGILARSRTYVLPSQACVNESVTTMNGFRDNAYLCIFCLMKYSKYVKTRCNLGFDKKTGYHVVAILLNDREYDNVVSLELSGIVSPVNHRDCDIIETYHMHYMTTNY
jgi:hypothetical protein